MCTKIQTYILKSVLNSSSCLQRENKPPSNFNALLLPTRTQKHHNSIILKTSHNEPVARAHLLNMQPQYETQIYERVLSGKGNQCKYCEGRSSCREGVYIHILNFMHFKIQNKLCKHNFFLQVKNKKVSMMSSGVKETVLCCCLFHKNPNLVLFLIFNIRKPKRFQVSTLTVSFFSHVSEKHSKTNQRVYSFCVTGKHLPVVYFSFSHLPNTNFPINVPDNNRAGH